MKQCKRSVALLLAAVCALLCLACSFPAFAEEGDAHSHTFVPVTVVAPSCTEPGLRRYICLCGEVDEAKDEAIPATGHRWGTWTTVREATTEQEGLKERTCLNDESHKDLKKIPKVEQSGVSKLFQNLLNRIKAWFQSIINWLIRD